MAAEHSSSQIPMTILAVIGTVINFFRIVQMVEVKGGGVKWLSKSMTMMLCTQMFFLCSLISSISIERREIEECFMSD